MGIIKETPARTASRVPKRRYLAVESLEGRRLLSHWELVSGLNLGFQKAAALATPWVAPGASVANPGLGEWSGGGVLISASPRDASVATVGLGGWLGGSLASAAAPHDGGNPPWVLSPGGLWTSGETGALGGSDGSSFTLALRDLNSTILALASPLAPGPNLTLAPRDLGTGLDGSGGGLRLLNDSPIRLGLLDLKEHFLSLDGSPDFFRPEPPLVPNPVNPAPATLDLAPVTPSVSIASAASVGASAAVHGTEIVSALTSPGILGNISARWARPRAAAWGANNDFSIEDRPTPTPEGWPFADVPVGPNWSVEGVSRATVSIAISAEEPAPELALATTGGAVPQAADLLIHVLPFDRATLERAIDQFLDQFDGLDLAVPIAWRPMSLVSASLAVAVAVLAWDVALRLRRPRSGTLTVGEAAALPFPDFPDLRSRTLR
jgi:hypothetical protein